MSKYQVISADSHVVEPKDLWTTYIAASYKERAPRVVQQEGADVFVCEGVTLLRPASMSRAGRFTAKDVPESFEEGVYPGAYNPRARLKDMAIDGVEAEVVYPSIAMRLYELPDAALRQACFQAYNSWAADFSKVFPDRLKAIAVTTLEDVEGAVSEVHRARKLGLVGMMISITSSDPELYGKTTYDPFFAAAQELDMPISLHVITDQKPLVHNLVEHTVSATTIQRSLASMVFSGVFLRFPRLKVVSAENDAGWAGYMAERMDYLFRRRVRWMEASPIKDKGMTPSEYFRRNVYMTFMTDHSAVYIRELVGVDHLMWSSDYPHNDSTWPHSQEIIRSLFQGVPTEHKRKIIADNAATLYGLP